MKRYVFSVIAGLCMAACSETFPGIEAEVTEKDYNSSEVTANKVPILVSFYDPNYTILTRGSGPFDEYEEDKEHWQSARFHIFAYRAPNDVVSSYDFTKKDETEADQDYCLIYDRIANLNVVSQGDNSTEYVDLKWEDGERRFYNSTHQDYKYNFYLAHTDDAMVGGWQCESDRVYANLKLDGTQDIITSVAALPESKQAILAAGGEQYKSLMSNLDNLIYSTYAAHRGVQPQFNVKHELVRLKFEVKTGDPKAQGVELRDITLLEPKTRARLTAAALDVDLVGISGFPWDAAQDPPLWHLSEKKEIVESEDYAQPEEGPFLKPLQMPAYGEPSMQVGTSFLALPDESYKIQLTCSQMVENLTTGEWKERVTHPTYEIRLKGDNLSFQPGSVYTINVTVYGIQDVSLSLGPAGWVIEEPIEIDPDKSTEDGTYDVIERTDY